jgi:NADPH:quinone reductase
VVLDPEDAEWVNQARAAFGGAGADVVFDNVGGSLGETAFELVAPGGRPDVSAGARRRRACRDRGPDRVRQTLLTT